MGVRDGRDYNFYKKVDVTWDKFGGSSSDGYHEDILIKYGSNTMMLLNENTTGVVEYSFDGVNLHGELDPTLPTRGMTFDNRPVSRIWFRVKSGSSGPIRVRIDAW